MMNILYQFNEAYVPFAGVSITSLLENNRACESINIFVFDEQISDKSKEKLVSQVETYGSGRKIEFIDTTEIVGFMKKEGIPSYRGSYAANTRMFAGSILDESIDRLLYLDADTVVENSLETLYTYNLEGKAIGASLDVLGGLHKQLIGMPENGEYINSGVLLYDLKIYREHGCEKMILDHVHNVRAHYMSPDQDLINMALRSEIKILGAEYNLQTPFFAYDYDKYMKCFGQSNMYDKEEVKRSLNKPTIVHMYRFLGEFPWHKNSCHPCVLLFDHYLNKSMWKDYEKESSNQNGLTFKIERIMYKCLPQGLFLRIFKIFYERFIRSAEAQSLAGENSGKM